MDGLDEYTSTEREGVSIDITGCPLGMINFKSTEQIVGFLVYVAQTYTSMVPYLKGI